MLKELREQELEIAKQLANNSERMGEINSELVRLEDVYPSRPDYMENTRLIVQEYDQLKGANEVLQKQLTWLYQQITTLEYEEAEREDKLRKI